VQDLTSKFTWKFVVVYGSPYEDKKDLSKLAGAMAYWGGGGRGILTFADFLQIKILVESIRNMLMPLMIG
jgi:hypothetical protein